MSHDPNSAQDPHSAPFDPNAAYAAAGIVDPHSSSLGAANAQDLTLPLYGASFMQAISRFFKKYTTFTGRASRSEYWYVYLLLVLVMLIPGIVTSIGAGMMTAGATSAAMMDPSDPSAAAAATAGASGPGMALTTIGSIIMGLFGLAVIIPWLALSWRRLHDANYAGPFWFLVFVPFVGPIIVLVFMVMPSKPEGRRFDT